MASAARNLGLGGQLKLRRLSLGVSAQGNGDTGSPLN